MDLGEFGFAGESEGFLPLLLAFFRKANDDVGRDRDVGPDGADRRKRLQKGGRVVFPFHPFKDARGPRLERDVKMIHHLGVIS